MSVERVYYCDGPDCNVNAQTATPPPYLPMGFLRVEQQGGDGRSASHFCTWDCVMRFAAEKEPTERIDVPAPRGGDVDA